VLDCLSPTCDILQFHKIDPDNISRLLVQVSLNSF
jgi:hypothetical protein